MQDKNGNLAFVQLRSFRSGSCTLSVVLHERASRPKHIAFDLLECSFKSACEFR